MCVLQVHSLSPARVPEQATTLGSSASVDVWSGAALSFGLVWSPVTGPEDKRTSLFFCDSSGTFPPRRDLGEALGFHGDF